MIRPRLSALLLLFGILGCTAELPFDPSQPFDPILDALRQAERQFNDAVADPLDARPYPVIVGGDSERVFYATTLTDVRLKIPGPLNDVVFQSFFGPSNLYQYADGQRSLLRPLIPAGAVNGIATDGNYLAYVAIADPTIDPPAMQLYTGFVDIPADELLLDTPGDGAQYISPQLRLDAGRLAYVVSTVGDERFDTLYVYSIENGTQLLALDAELFGTIDLFGDRLLYEAQIAGVRQVVLHDLATGGETVLAADVTGPTGVFLADNHAVWSESIDVQVQRVFAYELATGETRVWADAVEGNLTGATDTHFLTERRYQKRNDKAVRLSIVRHEADGKSRELADFRAEALAGQSQVLGDRAVYVKPDRHVVTAPLDGGSRKSFAPF